MLPEKCKKKLVTTGKCIETPKMKVRLMGTSGNELAADDVTGWSMPWTHAEASEVETGEVPVGAVLVGEDRLPGGGRQQPHPPHRSDRPCRDSGLQAGRRNALRNYRLPETTLYVTLEPCIMCMGALIQARIGRLVYGATDPKTGAAASLYTIGSDDRLNHTS